MARRKSERKKAAEDAAAVLVPLDVVRLILLSATPGTLWSARLVCKLWYALITSQEFVADRRCATGGAWLVTLHHMTRNARKGTKTPVVQSPWILIYNPLLNVQEKVSFPMNGVWPNPKIYLLYRLHMLKSEQKNGLTLCGHFARIRYNCIWNPVVGSIRTVAGPCSYGNFPRPQAPQDVQGPLWKYAYSGEYGDLMAFSAYCLKMFRHSSNGWEVMGEMPEDMWQIIGEKRFSFVATPNYYLIWTEHGQEPEMVVLFQSVKASWTWVDNIWHSRSHFCRWNKDRPVVLSCF